MSLRALCSQQVYHLPHSFLWLFAASKCATYLTLFSGSLQDSFLNASLTDQPIHCNLLGLAQPVSAVHGLLIHRWVPVAVIEDDLRTRNRWKQSTAVLLSMTTQYDNNTNDHALSGWPPKATKFLKVKVKGRVWGFFGAAACRPIVPLPPMSYPHSAPEAPRTT